MAQEDDLRALGKIMDFMRGISVIFLLINCYWFCYEAFHTWGFTLVIVDKVLMNFQRTTGLFSSILWTKLFCVLFLALSCLGTKGVKEEKITWPKIWTVLTIGFVLFFLNWWLLALPISKVGAALTVSDHRISPLGSWHCPSARWVPLRSISPHCPWVISSC